MYLNIIDVSIRIGRLNLLLSKWERTIQFFFIAGNQVIKNRPQKDRPILIPYNLVTYWLTNISFSLFPSPTLSSTSLTCSLACWVTQHQFFIPFLLPIATSSHFLLLYVYLLHSWAFQFHSLDHSHLIWISNIHISTYVCYVLLIFCFSGKY